MLRSTLFPLIFFFFFQNTALACTCVPETLATYAHNADLIFQGVVIETLDTTLTFIRKNFETQKPEKHFQSNRNYKFQITYSFKGIPDSGMVVVEGGFGGGSCGIGGEIGDEFFIFAKNTLKDSTLSFTDISVELVAFWTNGCLGSQRIHHFEKAEIDYLNETFQKQYTHPASREEVFQYGVIGLLMVFLILICVAIQAQLT